jgi:hypothetical protein
MNVCPTCGIPWDAGFFDESSIVDAPDTGQEVVLARYQLHRNYCGVLMSFAQYVTATGRSSDEIETPGYRWQIRCDGQPRDPYLTLDHILNPWGYGGYPVQLRLEEGCVVELVLRNVDVPAGDTRSLERVGGRLTGRYWYNTEHGGAPRRL